MERRDFFKILSTASAAAVGGCGHKSDKLIPLLVPEHQIVPGEEQWHPAVCTECAAGCATIVRVMEGVRTVTRNGEQFRERIAAIKKIEGNPLDPVSGGRLCARGQAAVQGLYHPDRLRGPLKRNGSTFTTISWDEAIGQAADKIKQAGTSVAFITGPIVGTRSLTIERFMQAIGAPAPVVCSLADHAHERRAADQIFGWKGLPVYDLARAKHALGVGVDFLGGWTSPVFYARQYGEFRQGRETVRGHFVHAESRLSLTAAAADRWLPIQPLTEHFFLAAVGKMLLDAKLARQPLDAFQSVDVPAMLAACGLDEKRLRPVVQQLGESDAPLVISGHPSGLYLNWMLGNIAKPGGVLPPAAATPPLNRDIPQARLYLVDSANPHYTDPTRGDASIIHFGSFLDDTAARADLILPGHHALESEMAIVPAVSARLALAVATPFVEPLYDTRAVESTLGEIAKRLGVEYKAPTVKELLPEGAAYDEVAREGGVWGDVPTPAALEPTVAALDLTPPRLNGDPAQYPLQFQPYLSLQFGEGAGANLPWLQELPDPASSGIWGLPVEIDPATAAKLQIATGDRVRIESPLGAIEAPAYVHPGAIPGVVSMPIGDGHTQYGRYASARGANPLKIAPGPTRVRLARVGGRDTSWIQFSAPDREERGFDHR